MTAETFAQRFPELSAALARTDLDALIAACERHEADAGEALVAEGTTSSDLFLVLEGNLDITMGAREGARRLAAVPAGSFFGEVSLLDPGAAEATIVTDQGCVVLRLSRARFDELSGSNPAAAVALLRTVIHSLAARLRRAAAELGQAVEVDDRGIAEITGDDAAAVNRAVEIGTRLAQEFREVTRRIRSRVVEVGRESVVKDYDVVVIGAGPHALAYATWIKQDRPETRIALVDKRTAPGFKIGESTLGPVVRAAMSLGVPLPVMRRLFNNKIGLHFWWMGEDSDELHKHVDHVVEETFQLERRVFELLMLNVARRAGVDVYQGARAIIDESRIQGQPKELVCENVNGDTLRLRSKILCDASGPAAVIGRHLGIRRRMADFNTSAYWAYFRKRETADLPGWEVPATRHLCFPQGWVWFIELASWEQAADANMNAMIDHLLDIRSPDETAYPTQLELAEQFGCPVEHWPISIGVVPRTDIDSAVDLPLEERFQHYVDRYPVFKKIMDCYDLIEEPYEGHPSYISYTEITQHSDRYAGDGWLLIGDAAYFVNPLYSPGLTYGHSLASFAAAETVGALERADFSEEAFKAHDAAARNLYSSLVSECEAWYRAFRHVDAYERIQLFRIAFFLSLGYERVLQFGGLSAMRIMRPVRPHGPKAEPITNPHYNEILRRLIDTMRNLEEKGSDPAETGRAVDAILDPVIEEMTAIEGVAALRIGEGLEAYDDRLRPVPSKEGWESLVPVWHCPRCEHNPPVDFDTCYICGEPAPAEIRGRRSAKAAPVPAGRPR